MVNDSPGTVLIIEPNFTGHRWRYAQWAAAAYIEAGYRCVIVTDPENAGHALARGIEEDNRPELQIQFVAPLEQGRRGLAKISYVRFFRDFRHLFNVASRDRKVALVVVPYVDYFWYALPLTGSPFGGTPWVGITMRANFHHAKVGVKAPREPLVNAVKAQLFRRALRTRGLKTLLTIDPTLTEWCAGTRGNRAGRQGLHGAAVQYLADPFPDTRANEPQLARARLGLGAGKHLLVYGAISERKGIQELVTALAQRRGGDKPTLVIAGAQDDETRAFLEALASGVPIVASNIRPFSFAADFPAVHLLDPEDTAEYARALVLALGEGRAQRPLGGLTLADTAERYLAVARQVTRGMATVVA